jgi:hypothetical protein
MDPASVLFTIVESAKLVPKKAAGFRLKAGMTKKN